MRRHPLNEFLANMSHEFRTPLNAVIGFAELLLESQTIGEEEKSFIQAILRNGQQLERLVDDLLDLPQVESERFTLEKVPFSLSLLIAEVISPLKLQAEAKGVRLTVISETELPALIVSDPARIRKALMHVIGNAIKFTFKGEVEIRVSSRLIASQPRDEVMRFIVRDTGIGISPEEQTRLFQPFSQADSSMQRQFGGSGLGLFLSRKFAQALGGDLTLESSARGEGSVFVMTIRPEVSEQSRAEVLALPRRSAMNKFGKRVCDR
jgi:hypothetical protein